jgi:hypothetical protein
MGHLPALASRQRFPRRVLWRPGGQPRYLAFDLRRVGVRAHVQGVPQLTLQLAEDVRAGRHAYPSAAGDFGPAGRGFGAGGSGASGTTLAAAPALWSAMVTVSAAATPWARWSATETGGVSASGGTAALAAAAAALAR